MNINTKSWHYRLIKFYNMRRPNDLCGYVRSLLLSLLLAVVCIWGVIAIVYVLGAMLFVGPVQLIWSMFDPTMILSKDATAFACIGIFVWLFAGIAGTFMYLKERKGWFQFKPSTKPKKPWLIVEYIKAKHSKVCTMVNYQ